VSKGIIIYEREGKPQPKLRRANPNATTAIRPVTLSPRMQTFKGFPPCQKPGSFSVGDAMDMFLNAEQSNN
jgi:hypothetical protein